MKKAIFMSLIIIFVFTVVGYASDLKVLFYSEEEIAEGKYIMDVMKSKVKNLFFLDSKTLHQVGEAYINKSENKVVWVLQFEENKVYTQQVLNIIVYFTSILGRNLKDQFEEHTDISNTYTFIYTKGKQVNKIVMEDLWTLNIIRITIEK